MKNILLVAIIFCFLRCGIETNTTDPQFSVSAEESKKNSLFLYELKCSNYGDSLFHFGEIWIEESWKNESEGGEHKIKRTGGMQLVFQISDYLNSSFNENSYVNNWTMKSDEINDYVGRSGNVYFLSLNNNKFQKKYDIVIIRDKDRKSIDTISFLLKRLLPRSIEYLLFLLVRKNINYRMFWLDCI